MAKAAREIVTSRTFPFPPSQVYAAFADPVEPGRRIAVLHEQEGHTFTLDMAMEAVAGGTRLTWRTTFATPEQLADVKDAFARGNEENLDRLGAFLATPDHH